ncbi:MAG: periplasmic heavy metal sensor [Candidatus Zixiibacteriota bacterium]|nr:MAG: periplasmic heavy metal sensor [candidate division Zixibacteria bacterium]
MKILKYSAAIIFTVLVSVSYGQPGPGPWHEDGPRRERMRKRIETVKIWQLTEAIGLTTEQSEKFFPIYNEHQKAHEKLMKDRNDVIEKLSGLAEKENPSEKEIRKAIDELTALDNRFASLRDEFIKDVSGVLSIKQIAKLLVFEEHFRRRLQENIRDIRRGMGQRRRDVSE